MVLNSLSYLTPNENHWATDIEADDLLDKATTIWCCCVINVMTKERFTFTDGPSFIAWLADHPTSTFVGHNFMAYDLPMLNRFWKTGISVKRVVDTFVLSQMFNPSMKAPKGCAKGGHSLEAWGLRLNYRKTGFSDFSACTPEMLAYCMNDTILTAYLFRKLTERMRMVGFTEEGAQLEHDAWHIIQNKQKRAGFPFNYEEGTKLHARLRSICEELSVDIFKLWPPSLEEIRRYKCRFKKDGSTNKQYERHVGQYPKIVDHADGGYSTYDYVSFNLGSPPQRTAKLLELGWTPVSFTDAGNPKVDEDSLLAYAELSGRTEVGKLARWIVTDSRANMIRTWLDAYNPNTGCIHGSLFIASTLRYRHSGPNSANIPAVRLKKEDGRDVIQYRESGAWSYEVRDLWTCGDPEEYDLVGLDGKGIQLRVLANYAYSDEFVSNVLSGDPHTKNIQTLGLANKAAAKKFLYTLLMGGGGAKLAADQAQFGTTLTAKDGERMKKTMIASVPGFNELIKRLKAELDQTGRITLCDGTPILVPSPHMVIPYKLQGDESRLMKRALIMTEEEVRKNKFTDKIIKVADIHDEWQYRVKKGYTDDFIAMALPCFLRSGESFHYRVPIEGSSAVGKTWAETH